MCWWEVVGQTEDLHAVTWERLTRLFREKYLGEARLAGKVREFLSIRQGKMSVPEYVGKFDELARFAPTIVPTDDARKMKFMHGLRLEVANRSIAAEKDLSPMRMLSKEPSDTTGGTG